jgi:hypothetical protein
MTKYAYIEFRDKVKKALQGEKDGLTWSQLKEKGEIGQTYMCYTWLGNLKGILDCLGRDAVVKFIGN